MIQQSLDIVLCVSQKSDFKGWQEIMIINSHVVGLILVAHFVHDFLTAKNIQETSFLLFIDVHRVENGANENEQSKRHPEE